jgi:hypothetical protein
LEITPKKFAAFIEKVILNRAIEDAKRPWDEGQLLAVHAGSNNPQSRI